MDIVIARCAALDVHKRSVMACMRTPDGSGGRRQQVRQFKTFLDDLEALRGWLVEHGVTHVVMEATGSYWKPFVRHEALCNREEMKGLLL